jgi:hypothetical protein
VLQEDSFQPFHIGRATSIYYRPAFPEKVRTQNTRGNNRQCFGIPLSEIIKTMNCSTRNKTSFTGTDVYWLCINREGQLPREPVNSFIIFLVIMRNGNFSPDRYQEFKHCQLLVGIFSFKQKNDRYLPDTDNFSGRGYCCHGVVDEIKPQYSREQIAVIVFLRDVASLSSVVLTDQRQGILDRAGAGGVLRLRG